MLSLSDMVAVPGGVMWMVACSVDTAGILSVGCPKMYGDKECGMMNFSWNSCGVGRVCESSISSLQNDRLKGCSLLDRWVFRGLL